VVNSPAALQIRFDLQINASEGRYLLLFHGTPLYNLRSILPKHLMPIHPLEEDRALLWTAETPEYSYEFAYKDFMKEQPCKGTSHKDWVAQLGSEVAGKGSNYGAVHTFRDVNSVML
jgi:hypothetical protein